MPRKGTGSGLRLHAKGYLQVTRRGAYYGWLEHRRIMYRMCLESVERSGRLWPYPLKGNLPTIQDGTSEGTPFTVEHVDHRRTHNCPANLLLLDKRIHDAISSAHATNLRRVRGKVEGWGWVADLELPDWVNQLEEAPK